MESVAAAAVLGLIVVAVIHAFNGGDSLKRWTNYVLTGRGPGRETTRPSWGIVAGQVQSEAADISANIGAQAEAQQARAARMKAGTSTAADVAAESKLAGAAIGLSLPSFTPAPTAAEAAAAKVISQTPGAAQGLSYSARLAQRVASIGGSHGEAAQAPTWAKNATQTRVAISDILAELAQRAKAAR